jgi:hypothetical protein
MKKILTFLLLISSILMIAAPLNVLADTPNITVIADKSATHPEVGGVLPNFSSMMGSGLIFDLMRGKTAFEVSIARVKLNGDVVAIKLLTGGPMFATKVGDVFFAAYNDKGQLTYLSASKNAVVGEYNYIWAGIDLNGGTTVRAFVWDLPTYIPLCEARDNFN